MGRCPAFILPHHIQGCTEGTIDLKEQFKRIFEPARKPPSATGTRWTGQSIGQMHPSPMQPSTPVQDFSQPYCPALGYNMSQVSMLGYGHSSGYGHWHPHGHDASSPALPPMLPSNQAPHHASVHYGPISFGNREFSVSVTSGSMGPPSPPSTRPY
jgi:hypothetical protein